MIKKISILLFLFPIILSAQYGESIRTARPGQAIGAFTLGKNVFQMQNGYGFTYLRNNNLPTAIHMNKRFGQNTVLRLGLTEHFEISGVVNWSTQTVKIDEARSSIGGISGTQIGARYNFTTNDGLLPTLGLQYRALLKLKSAAFQTNNIGSRFILSTGNKLSDNWSFTTNWILTFDGFQNDPDAAYVFNTSYSISDKWSTFFELFGSFNPMLVNFDTGLGYLVNKDFKLDLSAGYYDYDSSLDYFVDFGLSWRFDWRK